MANYVGQTALPTTSDEDVQPHAPSSRRVGFRSVIATGALALAGVALLSQGRHDVSVGVPVTGLTGLYKARAPAPELCTDGTKFGFKFEVDTAGSAEQIILTSSNDVLSVVLSSSDVTVSMKTLSRGTVTATTAVPKQQSFTVAVEKHEDMLAITTTDGVMVGMSGLIDYPLAQFQMAPLGSLQWGEGPSHASNFEQTEGNVPISFAVATPMQKLWENQAQWTSVTEHMEEMLAALAEDGTALDVTVHPASPVNADNTLFQATVQATNPAAGAACAIQSKLQKAVQSGLFLSALEERVSTAKLSVGDSIAGDVSVPAKPLPCSLFRCRTNFPATVPEGAKCIGGSCKAVCCADALGRPLPFVSLRPEEETKVAAVEKPAALPKFTMPDLQKAAVEREEKLAPAELKASHGLGAEAEEEDEEPMTSSAGVATTSFNIAVGSSDNLTDMAELLRNEVADLVQVDVAQITVEVNQVSRESKVTTSTWSLEEETVEHSESLKKHDEKKLSTLLSGKAWNSGDYEDDEDTMKEVEELARLGNPTGLPSTDVTAVDIASKSAPPAHEAEYAEERRRLEGGATATVHITIGQCPNSCINKLVSSTFQSQLERSLGRPAESMASPGKPKQCSQHTCSSDVMLNTNPSKKCFGPQCEKACCKPRPCPKVACPNGQRKPWSNFKTCQNEEECGDKCCAMKCSKKTCPPGWCPNADATTTNPVFWLHTCCHRRPKCCDAPIAWCVSCLKCQTVSEYCAAESIDSAIHALKKNITHAIVGGLVDHVLHHGDERLLAEDDSQLPFMRNLSAAALPPMGVGRPKVMPSAELDSGSIQESPALRGAASAKANARNMQKLENRALKAGMADAAKKAVDFFKKHCHGDGDDDSDDSDDEDVVTPTPAQVCLTMEAIRKDKIAKLACHGPRGCETVTVSSCSYYYDTAFCLHRGHFNQPKPVNTVAVLQDTIHAVSCGDEGACWVWHICDGRPHTHFVPDSSIGPLLSTAVLFDGIRIVSAGVAWPFGGAAYVWEWRTGNQVAALRCHGAPFLSAAEIPEWRTVLVGCADGYTSAWNWEYGKQQQVPFISQTLGDVILFAEGLASKCDMSALSGLEKLIKPTESMTEQTFLDAILPIHPELMEKTACLGTISKFFFGWSLGAVNAVAYVPTNVRFVTGHGDGRVRYWNAHTGALIRCMWGHLGPVNAIVGSLVRQEAYSGGEDGTIRTWCLKTGIQKMLFIQDYGGPILSIAIYPSNRMVLAGSTDGYVRFWDTISGAILCAINTGGGAVNGLAINPSGPLGQVLAAGADGLVRVFSPR